MENEIWKDIPTLKGRYQASNFGNIRSVNRYTTNGSYRTGKVRILTTDRYGYKRVSIVIDNKVKSIQVHRLVAMTFLPNPQNLPCVNHIDENRGNNYVSNLEWCDDAYNINYGNRNKNAAESLTQSRRHKISSLHKSKPVMQFDSKTGEILHAYNSIQEAARKCGFKNPSHIYECCNQKHKTAYGYVWKYVDMLFYNNG